jgi:ComEC/Rec2-related protein
MDTGRVATPIDERDVYAPPLDDLPPAFPVPVPPGPGTVPPASRRPVLPPALLARWSKQGQEILERLAPSVRGIGPSMRAAVVLEIERGTPFLLVPVFLAIGAIVYFNLTLEPDGWMLVLAVAIAVALYGVTRHHPFAKFPGAALSLILAGLVLGGIETARHQTLMLGGEISTTLTGRVVDMDLLDSGRTRLVIDVIDTEKPKLRYAPQRVRVSARAVPAGLQAGSVVKGLARLQPPSGPMRPGSYDFSFESYFDGIGATGFFMRGPELVAGAAPVTRWQAFTEMIANTRQEIADRVRARIGGAEGDIAAALMVGVRAGIPDDVNEAMRRSGLYHIISISGLHMALVAGVFMGFLRAVLALFPGFASRHPVKKIAAFGAILAIAAYLFISGGEVAAERSFIMLAVMLAAVLFDRAALTMRNLAISAMVVMVLSPHEIVGPSFQMSFAATAALVGAFAWGRTGRHGALGKARSRSAVWCGQGWRAPPPSPVGWSSLRSSRASQQPPSVSTTSSVPRRSAWHRIWRRCPSYR